MSLTLLLENVDTFVFDFDGVLTDNRVHLDQNGNEWVSCSRADGLAFDVLRKLEVPAYILSTEKNPVVTARARKLKITALQGVANKVEALGALCADKNYDLERIVYVGNDVNDFRVMQICGYSLCPADSHELIRREADYVVAAVGGNGVVRDILENVFKLDFVQILYPE